MIIKDTVPTKDIRRRITGQVGDKFTFLERFRMKGIGSQRYSIVDASRDLDDLLLADTRPKTCNIEMRKKGIIVRFQSRIDTYAWTIPYYSLNLFINGPVLSVFGKGNHLKLTPAHNEPLNRKFLSKVLEHQSEFSYYNFPPR